MPAPPSTPSRAGSRQPWSSSATSPAAPRRAPRSSCTAGLRYLEMFDFALVKEALEERGLLLTRLAPHLVRPVPFLYPLHHTWERPVCRRRPDAVRRDGAARSPCREVRHGSAPAQARLPAPPRADGTRPAHRRAEGCDPLLRLPGRRRPAGDEHRPHCCGVRRPRRLAHQGRRLPPRGRPSGRRARRRPGERPRGGGAGPRRHQCRRRLDQRDPGHARWPRRARRRGQQGHPSRRTP